MSNEVQNNLLPTLEDQHAKLTALPKNQKHRKSMYFGEMDERILEHIERGCNGFILEASPDLRRSCQHIVEEYGDKLVATISKWPTSGRAISELRASLCTKLSRACRTSDLNLVPHANVPGPNANRTEFFSERPPAFNPEGPMQIAVGSTLNDTLNNHTDKDLVVYYYFPHEARHAMLEAKVHRVAEMMWTLQNRPNTFRFAKINSRLNNLVPPWDQIKRTTMLIYGAGREPIIIGPGTGGAYNAMKMLEWLEPLDLTLHEILSEMQIACKSHHTQRHLGNLMYHLGTERLYPSEGELPWWEDDALLARAKEPIVSQGKEPAAKEPAAATRTKKKRKARKDEL